MSGVLGMLPCIGRSRYHIAEANLDDKVSRAARIITSMTPKERRSPKLTTASASGALRRAPDQVQEVNRLLKMHRQADKMKAMGITRP